MKIPLDNFNACDDFFVMVIDALILTAGMKMMKMDNLDEVPSDLYVADPQNFWMLPKEDRLELIQTIAMKIVDMFVDVSFNDHKDFTYVDKTNLYARNLLSLGLFYFEYSDAIREGDGERVLRCWRYMLPMFISSGRKNYAIEAFNLLLQHDFSLPPRQAAKLIWGRFVNTSGLPGRNISNDLHMIVSLRRLFRILEAVKQKQLLQDWEKYYEFLIQCYKILIKILVFLPHLGSTRSPKKTRTSILF